MRKYYCMNPIAQVGLDNFSKNYIKTDEITEAEGILVRSTSMHDMELPDGLLAVARAGAGVNNIPLEKCAEKGIVVFNTPGANANGVKELVIAGMLLASRDVVSGINWVEENQEDENIAKDAEKAKKKFAGTEVMASASVSSDWARSASRLLTWRVISEWKCSAMIRMYRSMRRGS